MLFPKKVKHRKWHKMRRNPNKIGLASRGTSIAFGSFGIKTLDYERITSNQIEAARRAAKRHAGKSSKMWTRIFPDRPYTAKAPETPMGSGKGDLQGYEVEVKPGRMLFEIDGVEEEVAREAFRKAATKLPVKTKFVSRDDFVS
jgi:large subunit ribosomal protein L16